MRLHLRFPHGFATRETVLPKHALVEGSFEREIEEVEDMTIEGIDRECLQSYKIDERDPQPSKRGPADLVIFDDRIVHQV